MKKPYCIMNILLEQRKNIQDRIREFQSILENNSLNLHNAMLTIRLKDVLLVFQMHKYYIVINFKSQEMQKRKVKQEIKEEISKKREKDHFLLRLYLLIWNQSNNEFNRSNRFHNNSRNLNLMNYLTHLIHNMILLDFQINKLKKHKGELFLLVPKEAIVHIKDH